MTTQELLSEVTRLRVLLDADGDRLRVEAPREGFAHGLVYENPEAQW